MSKSVLSLLLLGACATGTAGVDREASPQTGAHLELSQGARSAFRSTGDLQLPSADAMSIRIRERLGDEPAVKVDLCLGADGRVSSVALVRGTTMEMFDRAVLRDVATWQFAATAAPPSEKACQRKRIVYHPRRA
jgi:TonB family protein